MLKLKLTLLIVAAFLLLALSASAQDSGTRPETPPAPCRGGVWWTESAATYADFDFWVGEWQVYDFETGELNGFDEIEKAFGGCALRQHWRQLNDRFSLPGSDARLDGGSVTWLGPDGRWHQTWIDNTGSAITVRGGFDDSRTMVLESDWLEFTGRSGQRVRAKYRWHWQPQADGTIRNWGLRGSGAEGTEVEWAEYFDIVYRRNAPSGPSARLDIGSD